MVPADVRHVHHNHVVVDGVGVSAQPIDECLVPVAVEGALITVVKVAVPQPRWLHVIDDGSQHRPIQIRCTHRLIGKTAAVPFESGDEDSSGTVVAEHHICWTLRRDRFRVRLSDSLLRPPSASRNAQEAVYRVGSADSHAVHSPPLPSEAARQVHDSFTQIPQTVLGNWLRQQPIKVFMISFDEPKN